MRFTADTVHKIANHAKEISGGRFSFAYKANPGDGVRYVDGTKLGLVWTGSGAAHRAASYYLGVIEAYNPGTVGDLPDYIREALSAAAKRTGYEKWHNVGMDDARNAMRADAPREYVVQGNYGSGWEDVNTETTKEDGYRSLEEYRENEPQYSHRLRTRIASK
ncbi:hypothetical protein [Streptomyces albidoflavus]|uniref:hypothetical protein n=1 Tax=Streptomyces albidoflavus TaxID=1886 RepID=UPI0033F520EC